MTKTREQLQQSRSGSPLIQMWCCFVVVVLLVVLTPVLRSYAAGAGSDTAGAERGIQRSRPAEGNVHRGAATPESKTPYASAATLATGHWRPVRDKWALVVGISTFAKPELNLKFADKDAEAFYKYLVEDARFARDHVKLLVNEQATQHRILSEIGKSWLPRIAGPDDLVVIFLSTHGSPADSDTAGVNYLLCEDSDPDDLFTSGIEMEQLARIIKAKVHAQRVVVILDACHSGASKTGASQDAALKANVDAGKFALSSGQLVIASSLPDQESWEYQSRPNGVFSACLLEGLRSKGEATTLGQAFAYAKTRVQDTVLRERGALQIPVLKSAWKGDDLVLAVEPAAPQPPLPEPAAEAAPALAEASKPPALLSEAAPQLAPSQNSAANTAAAAPDPIIDDIEPDPIKLPPEPAANPLLEPGQTPARRIRPPSLPDKVAILGFSERPDLDTGANYLNDPATNLEFMVSRKLREVLGRRLIRTTDAATALADVEMSGEGIFSQENLMSLGLAFGARYILTVNIEDLHFDKNNNCYFGTILRVASGETGDLLCVEGKRTNCPPYNGDKAGRLQYLKTVVFPACAEQVCQRVLSIVNQAQ